MSYLENTLYSKQKFGKTLLDSTVFPIDVISVEDAKSQLRVDLDDDDQYIELLISTAFNTINNYTNRVILESTITYTTEAQNLYEVLLPYEANVVISVSIDSVPVVFTIDNYRGDDTYIQFDEPVTGIVEVVFVSGYTMKNIPPIYKEAAYLLVDHWYEIRELVAIRGPEEIPMMLDILLDTKRRMII